MARSPKARARATGLARSAAGQTRARARGMNPNAKRTLLAKRRKRKGY